MADGVSQPDRSVSGCTVRRLLRPTSRRAMKGVAGSMLDPPEPVLRRLLEEWPQIRAPRVIEILRTDYRYAGSLDFVRRQLPRLRPPPLVPPSGSSTAQARCASSPS
jgi:hypothetical protein